MHVSRFPFDIICWVHFTHDDDFPVLVSVLGTNCDCWLNDVYNFVSPEGELVAMSTTGGAHQWLFDGLLQQFFRLCKGTLDWYSTVYANKKIF